MSAPNATKSKAATTGLTVITPTATATFANVWKPRAGLNPENGEKYSVVLVFPKGTDLSKMRAAAKLAATNKWGAKLPSNLKNPFRNGDAEKPDDPVFKGAIFITARTANKPGIVDQSRNHILDEMDFYSGCRCRASVYASAYDQKGNKGVTFLLNNLQKVADGPRLSGRKPAEEEFDDIGGDDGEGGGDDDMFS